MLSASGTRTSPLPPSTISRLPAASPSTPVTRPMRLASRRFDGAVDQIVTVKRPRGQRLQRVGADAQLAAGQRLGRVHRVDAREPDNRPAPVEPDMFHGHRFGRVSATYLQYRARLESLFRKIGRRIDDDVAAVPVSARDAAHHRHIVPLTHRLQASGLRRVPNP